MDVDDRHALLLWILVVAGLTVQCLASDMCAFDAYQTCMRHAEHPAECERLLPREWRR